MKAVWNVAGELALDAAHAWPLVRDALSTVAITRAETLGGLALVVAFECEREDVPVVLVPPPASSFRVSAALDADLARRPPRIGFGLSFVGAANDLHADHPRQPGTNLRAGVLARLREAGVRVTDGERAPSGAEVMGMLHVTLAHGGPDERVEIPKVPG